MADYTDEFCQLVGQLYANRRLQRSCRDSTSYVDSAT